MNQSQVKYARQRAEAIRDTRKAALRKKHTTQAIRLTLQQKLDALREGSFVITAEPDNSYNRNWYNHVEFPPERSESFDQVAFDTDVAVLDASFRKIEDELVLGDNETALALLKEFEAGEMTEINYALWSLANRCG